MESLSVIPTSKSSAITDDIVLRNGEQVRLIFRPLIINNSHDSDASVRGVFVYQRKSKNQQWVDITEQMLSNLKAGEGYKLDIKSEELLKLFKKLDQLYSFYHQHGIPRSRGRFIAIEQQLEALLSADKNEFNDILEARRDLGKQMFERLVGWLSNEETRARAIELFDNLNVSSLQELNAAIGVNSLKKALAIWHENQDESDEEFWQQTLMEHSHVLAQVFSFPVVIIKGKAYVGGKSIMNSGGNYADFLIKNQLTGNAALVEIKTPQTKIVTAPYRGTYNMSPEVVGSVMQVSHYRNSLLADYRSVLDGIDNPDDKFEVFDPQCLVVVGSLQSIVERDKRKAFELFRNSLKDVKVITYEELFGKVQTLVDLLEGNVPGPFDDIPF